MSGDTTTEREETWYFEIQARLGFTKHLGGEKATRELAELCQVGEETTILNVGCGAGISACYLAKTYGCRVIGVDISERMLAQAQAQAGGSRQGRFQSG